MKKTNLFVLRLLVVVMIAAFTLTGVSCVKEEISNTTQITTLSQTLQSTAESTVTEDSTVTRKGEGQTSFGFKVTFADGSVFLHELKTDKEKLDEALLELGLIEGTTSEFGLYVTAVCGVSYDFTADQKWWQFQITEGEMATEGISSVTITEGATYYFAATNA